MTVTVVAQVELLVFADFVFLSAVAVFAVAELPASCVHFLVVAVFAAAAELPVYCVHFVAVAVFAVAELPASCVHFLVVVVVAAVAEVSLEAAQVEFAEFADLAFLVSGVHFAEAEVSPLAVVAVFEPVEFAAFADSDFLSAVIVVPVCDVPLAVLVVFVAGLLY